MRPVYVRYQSPVSGLLKKKLFRKLAVPSMFGVGHKARRFFATGSILSAGIMLLGNGVRWKVPPTRVVDMGS